jgi:hypothetical protein
MFVQDARDFKEVYFQEPSLYVLEYEDNLITAFSMVALNISTFLPVHIDYASEIIIAEGPGKVFVMNKDVLNTSVDDKLIDMTGYDFEDGLSSEYNDIRASTFLISLVTTLEEKETLYVIKQVRNDKMAILPRSFAVKVLTFDAKIYIEKIKNIIGRQKDSVVSVINESKKLLDVNVSI